MSSKSELFKKEWERQQRHPAIVMASRNSGMLVENIGIGMSPFQGLVEIIRNSYQARATKVEFDVSWDDLEETGVYKLSFSDDGDGIPVKVLREWLHLGMTGPKGLRGSTQYGAGAKVSCAPFNPEGCDFTSWVDGIGHHCILAWFPYIKEFGLRPLPVCDENGDYIPDDRDLPAEWAPVVRAADSRKPASGLIKEKGTKIVFHGKDPEENTFLSWGGKKQGLRWIMLYLNRRLYRPSIPISIRTFKASDPDKWPRSKEDISKLGKQGLVSWEKVEGVEAYLDRVQARLPEVRVAGATICAWYKPGSYEVHHRNGAGSSYHAISYFAYEFEGEIFGAVYRERDKTNKERGGESVSAYFQRAGVYAADVKKDLTLLVRPDAYDEKTGCGVKMELNRSKLTYYQFGVPASELPLSLWLEEFARSMPNSLKEACNKAEAAIASTSIEDLNKDLQRYYRESKILGRKLDPNGEQQGVTKPVGGLDPKPKEGEPEKPKKGSHNKYGRSGPQTIAQASESRAIHGAPRAKWVHGTQREWFNEDKENDFGSDGKKWGGVYRHQRLPRMIELNEDYPLVQSTLKERLETTKGASPAQIREAVLRTLAEFVAHKVIDLQALKGNGGLTHPEWEELVKPSALTVYMFDRVSFDARFRAVLAEIKRRQTDADTDDVDRAPVKTVLPFRR